MLTTKKFHLGSKSEHTPKNVEFDQKNMITVHLTQNENNCTCLLLNQHNYANEMPFHSEI